VKAIDKIERTDSKNTLGRLNILPILTAKKLAKKSFK
jgi:hypothetical protein